MNGMHGIIFSYEKESDLRELIAHRIHGSIPIGGHYRIVDFALSNMVNAGIQDVGVIMHGKCQSLLDHLGTGKSWDLSRNHGGLTLLPAFAYAEGRGRGAGKFRGKMDALGYVMDYLAQIRQDYVVLSDSDVVINLPLEDVRRAHEATGADITAVCTAVPGESSDTYFHLDSTGRITDVAYDVPEPSGYQCLNLFVMRTELLLRLVEECRSHNLYSFRHRVLQDRAGELHLHAYVWDGYAQRIRTVRSYYECSMDLLQPEVRAQLFDPARPILARDAGGPVSYIDPAGECVNSLIADGCNVEGTVRGSILSPGVRIEPGAEVSDCILLRNTVVHRGAVLRHVIADKNVVVTDGHALMGSANYPLVISRDTTV
jgi:glucose-1-phosphate adenylyltransferase